MWCRGQIKITKILITLSLVSGFIPLFTFGQELHEPLQGFWKAEVKDVLEEKAAKVPGTEIETRIQTIEVEILEGEKEGEVVTLDNDYLPLEIGDRFFMNYLVTIDGVEIYSVRDVDRSSPLIFFIGLFIVAVLLFAGKQGFRSILGLLITFLVIIYVLLPLLLKGYPPVLTSTLISALILFFAIYFTHGFNRESSVALGGTIIAVSLTGILAFLAVKASSLTGFASDEAIYLNVSTFGQLDLSGLLLAGIIIGFLGVLDDIAITQSAVVSELYRSAPNLTKKEVYKKALRVGREHAGALVNTLALAYTGAALPLLLLFYTSEATFGMIVNQEVFSSEIIRTIIGSIGLILTIPITTLLAVFVLEKYRGKGEAAGKKDAHTHGHTHLH